MDAGNTSVDLIVCLDANFQLKRNRDRDQRQEYKGQARSLDPEVTLPRTIFLSESQIRVWEERVEAVRPSRPKSGDKRKAKEMETTEADLMDGGRATEIEPGMNLPNATYDACRDSFIAADGDQIKASSTFFDSTGVMAMLCHHDRPLLLANLKTAGEKQFYAFVLISALMNSLPGHWRVGILYNIGCQLHRTLQKWDFMPQFFHRLVFAVSIFHAYGHQWACQLWYHPRKAELWGLSDGEGCERFWSEAPKVNPRSQGHWGVLHGLTRHLIVEYIHEMKQAGMGKWLRDQVHRANERLNEALAVVDACPHQLDLDGLLAQFKEQREFQTKSVDRQSRTKGTWAIEQILALEGALESQRGILVMLSKELGGLVRDDSVGGQSLHKEWKERRENIAKKIKALRLQDRTSADRLASLKKDKWINLQLNIRVLQDQLLKKLHARKFELANLECAHTSQAMGMSFVIVKVWISETNRNEDQKTKAHVEKAVKHRAPGIDVTLNKYNALRKDMLRERGKNGVKRDAYVPPELSIEGLYKLDVDQDIWQNADMADFEGGKVPLWLSDTEVQDGIRAAQEVKSCQEELFRCEREHSNLRLWLLNDYEAV
ncbi:hypothetical protein BS47DRAFT_1393737 [Hydnum rufescens UP504]|uniref:Transposase n=1 Tax=Hydnum rufescens UP504 TaxID=1448309 RepID=A0A9P6DT99_9AGAM|nr:hypothetical protein BS47DRAFT_1393737 [Hydnum rufescens UP504]